jgi:hypothetical protein
VALVAVNVLPWTGDQVAAVALAVSAVVDCGLYFGLIHPRKAQPELEDYDEPEEERSDITLGVETEVDPDDPTGTFGFARPS